jgi:hypothetical protein
MSEDETASRHLGGVCDGRDTPILFVYYIFLFISSSH